MKDAYSFDLTREGGQHSYNKMFVSYLRTFARMGLKADARAGQDRADQRQGQPRVPDPRRYG